MGWRGEVSEVDGSAGIAEDEVGVGGGEGGNGGNGEGEGLEEKELLGTKAPSLYNAARARNTRR